MANIKRRIFKRMRDFLPNEMIHKEEILKLISSVFQDNGIEPIEMPAIEYINVVKSGFTSIL